MESDEVIHKERDEIKYSIKLEMLHYSASFVIVFVFELTPVTNKMALHIHPHARPCAAR